MAIEVVTHGGGEVMRYVFNAVAAITSGSAFIDLILATIAAATLWIGFRTAFGISSLRDNAMWFGVYLVLYNAMIIPKETVLITDKLDPTYSADVDNVPYGLAMIAGYSSSIGNGLAELFDTAFALPNDQAYSDIGFLFGNKVVRDALKLKIRDLEFSANMSEFVNQCVLYDIETARKYTYDDLLAAEDIWEFLTSDNVPSRVWMFNYAENGDVETLTCAEGVVKLEAKWEAETADQMVYLYERNFGKADTDAIAVNYMATQLQNSNDFLIGISNNASQIVRQNLMINALNTATNTNSNYADIIAELEAQQTHIRTANISQKSIIFLQILLQAFFYAVFPVIFLFFILPGGLVFLKGYVKGFVWIQLWPILYSIFHLFLSLENKDSLEFISGRLNFANSEIVDEIMDDIAIMAGYLMASIPIFSWAILTGMQSMGYAVTGFMSASLAAASSAATEGARGNYNLGNSSYDNHSFNNTSANKIDTSRVSNEFNTQLHNQDGSISTIHGDGHETIDTTPKMHRFNTDLSSRYSMEAATSSLASQSKTMGDNFSKEAQSALSSSVETASRLAENFHQAKERGESWTKGVDANTQAAFEKFESMSSKSSVNVGASAEASKSFGVKVPFTDIGVDAKIGVNAGVNKDWSSEEQDQIREYLDTIQRASQSGTLNFQDTESQSLNKELNSSVSEYKQLSERSETYYNQAENLTNEARRAEELGASYSQNLANDFFEYLTKEKGYSQTEAINVMEDPDRIQTMDKLFHEYANDHIGDMYRQKFGTELFDSAANMSYDARSAEFDNKHARFVEDKSKEVEGQYDIMTANNGVSVEQGDLKQEVNSQIKKNQQAYQHEKSGTSSISGAAIPKSMKDKLDDFTGGDK